MDISADFEACSIQRPTQPHPTTHPIAALPFQPTSQTAPSPLRLARPAPSRLASPPPLPPACSDSAPGPTDTHPSQPSRATCKPGDGARAQAKRPRPALSRRYTSSPPLSSHTHKDKKRQKRNKKKSAWVVYVGSRSRDVPELSEEACLLPGPSPRPCQTSHAWARTRCEGHTLEGHVTC
eukprot:58211-Rhodomonas_salina.2